MYDFDLNKLASKESLRAESIIKDYLEIIIRKMISLYQPRIAYFTAVEKLSSHESYHKYAKDELEFYINAICDVAAREDVPEYCKMKLADAIYDNFFDSLGTLKPYEDWEEIELL